MNKSLGIVFLVSLFSFSYGQSTFRSIQTGDWNDASTWRSGAGAGGTTGIDFPAPTDNVFISDGDTVYIDFGTTGTLYEYEGTMEIDTAGLLWVEVGTNTSGLALINNARLFNRGSVYIAKDNEGPGTVSPDEIDMYLEDNSIYYAFENSFNYCSDDIHIRDNAIFFVELNVCVEIDDDFHLQGSNSILCGEGGASIGVSTADNEVILEGTASTDNVCSGLEIFRGVGATCNPTSGTSILVGTGPTNLRPRAISDEFLVLENTATNLSVLYQGEDDLDLDGPSLEIISVGSNGAINDNLSNNGGTLSINNNSTPANFSDDFIVYTPLAGFIGVDFFEYIIEDDDGAIDTALVSLEVSCGVGSITTNNYSYATYESDLNGVVNNTNANGAPNGDFAQIDNNNQQLILDLGQVFSAGTQYEITWRRKNSVGTGTAIIDLSESTLPGTGFVAHPTSPQNIDNVSFTTTTVTSNVDFRYIAFDKGNSSTVDYEIDAVGVISSVTCEADTDGDGISNSLDVDDDNDGIQDINEACPDYTSIVESQLSVDNSASIGGIPDGNYAEIHTNGDEITIDFGRLFLSGTQFIFNWRRRPGSTGTAIPQIFESEDNNTYVLRASNPTSAVNTAISDTLTSENNFRYLRFTKTNPPSIVDYQIDAVGIISCKDSDGDGVHDYLDLDSDNDGVLDIIESGGIDADRNGKADINADSDSDGLLDLFDTDNGGSVLVDGDQDSDGIPNRIDLDSDNDGIFDNIESQSTISFIAPSGSDADGDGIDDSYDNDGGTPIILSNIDGSGEPDYLDLDSDDDGLFDWSEGFDDNNTEDALDDYLIRADAFEVAAGSPMYYVNTVDADTDGIPDWAEDDDADNLPNFLDSDNGFYQDTDQDGIVDLFDTDNGGAISNTPDGDSDGEYDFRDSDNLVSLPVEIVYFKAEKFNDAVKLSWETFSELNNNFFTIERSSDGNEFIPIVIEKGNGNSLRNISYAVYDENPHIGYNFYRLKQTDYDGDSEYHGIQLIEFDKIQESEIKLYPNPSDGSDVVLKIKSALKGNYELQIFNSSSVLMKNEIFSINNNEFEFNYLINDLNLLKRGLYLVRLTSIYNSTTIKLVIK